MALPSPAHQGPVQGQVSQAMTGQGGQEPRVPKGHSGNLEDPTHTNSLRGYTCGTRSEDLGPREMGEQQMPEGPAVTKTPGQGRMFLHG